MERCKLKGCELVCNEGQTPMDLLDIIEQESRDKGYEVERYTSEQENDSLLVHMKAEGLPDSRLTVFPSTPNVDIVSVGIVNITLAEKRSGTLGIGCPEYNKLLGIYRDDVFAEISKKCGNTIETFLI